MGLMLKVAFKRLTQKALPPIRNEETYISNPSCSIANTLMPSRTRATITQRGKSLWPLSHRQMLLEVSRKEHGNVSERSKQNYLDWITTSPRLPHHHCSPTYGTMGLEISTTTSKIINNHKLPWGSFALIITSIFTLRRATKH